MNEPIRQAWIGRGFNFRGIRGDRGARQPIGELCDRRGGGCPDVDVSFARGTNDSPGLGDVGKAFTDELTDRLAGKSVDIYAVNYPASFDWVRAGDGANDMSYHVQEVARNCPNTQFVLGGFSQGAAVVDVLFGTNGTGSPSTTRCRRISKSVLPQSY